MAALIPMAKTILAIIGPATTRAAPKSDTMTAPARAVFRGTQRTPLEDAAKRICSPLVATACFIALQLIDTAFSGGTKPATLAVDI